jgi:hypothetical protein
MPSQVIAQDYVIGLREHGAKILFIEKRQADVFKLNGPVDRSHNRALGDFREASLKLTGCPRYGQHRATP